MTRNLRTTLTASAAILLMTVAPGIVAAESPQPEKQDTAQMQGHMHGESMHSMHGESPEMDCQQMQAMMKEMHAKRQKMQTRLDDLVARMNSTSGDSQQEAIVELLTTMVEQRGAMQNMMSDMQPMMMRHMMDHMQAGGHGAMGGASDCPMMHQTQHAESGSKGEGDATSGG